MPDRAGPVLVQRAGRAAAVASDRNSMLLPGETVVTALQSIRANLLRAGLTALGIIIGVAALIAMVALGSGAQKAVEASISALGTNLLRVFPGQSFQGGVASANRVSLTLDDAQALERDGRLFTAVVPEIQQQVQVKLNNHNGNLAVIGTTANYTAVQNSTIKFGRMFSAGDDAARQRYAVVGASVPDLLGANQAAIIGQEIQIAGASFEVIGVLSEKGSSGSFVNVDEQILIPLETARYRLFGTDRLRALTVQIMPGIPLERGMVDIERVLRREHKIRPGADNDFQIRNQQDILSTQQQATQVFTYLLAGIAAVSLLVGGIGIMNIMLVSVTERTREIGVRMALGASRRNIMLQFLIEALVLCTLGGTVGILLGAGLASAATAFLHWNTLVSLDSVILAFGFSAAVGVIFGLWPARRAARLDPIEALRYE
ncbi:MAG TPA: ABC transporter permease [Gemmatimonadales bacterium]|nr:ABC transporter permease [Gemmatimonadales bacterium]